MDKLLTIGASGLVGSKISALSEKHGYESYNTTKSRRTSLARTTQLDITDEEATLRLVRQIKPAVIINTAAVTNVDYCETHTEEAQRINVDGVRNLAEAIEGRGTRFIQISTDFVFDGTGGHYSERDDPRPLNRYGQTKLDAERIVAKLPNYAIARPSVIYGWNPDEPGAKSSDTSKPMNFAMFVLDKLRRNESVKAVKDQYSSPTFANNLAEGLLRLARHGENGVFHTAGRSCLSRYEFATRIAQIFGYETRMIEPVLSSEFKQIALRPKNSCLSVEWAERKLRIRFQTADEGISEMKRLNPTVG